MTDKRLINENELDGLLRDLSLEENSHTVNDEEANFVLQQQYNVIIDPKKEKELLKKLQNKRGGFSSLTLLFIVVGISTIITLLFYWYTQKSSSVSGISQKDEITNRKETSTHQQENYLVNNINSTVKMRDTFGRPMRINSAINSDSGTSKITNNPVQKLNTTELNTPILTEQDKIKYRAIKELILKALIRSDKGLYTKIPAYETQYAGKSIVLDAFTIRNVGITNLEYKTFLADLLVQNRNEDYMKCQVHNENWASHDFSNLETAYFRDQKYNDFPVVNVSYAAAKIFCNWLEDETRIYLQKNGIKNKTLQIRLPYDEEWIFAAREGYAKIAYEKGYNTIYDESSGLVDRSFTHRIELVKKRVKRVDTLYSVFTTNRFDWNEKQTTNFFESGFKYYADVANDTIYSDRMKVLGKIGHVSEMVPQKNSNRIWLAGLSWKNKEEYQKLEQEFKTNTSSPFVGFRIVVVNPNDPEYKKPFW